MHDRDRLIHPSVSVLEEEEEEGRLRRSPCN
jgi:hypothetical protein